MNIDATAEITKFDLPPIPRFLCAYVGDEWVIVARDTEACTEHFAKQLVWLQSSKRPHAIVTVNAGAAPRPMRLQWKTDNDGATFYADTPFGRYKVGKSWWTFNDGSDHNFDGHDENKTAAEAHFDERVAKCMEPPYAG